MTMINGQVLHDDDSADIDIRVWIEPADHRYRWKIYLEKPCIHEIARGIADTQAAALSATEDVFLWLRGAAERPNSVNAEFPEPDWTGSLWQFHPIEKITRG